MDDRPKFVFSLLFYGIVLAIILVILFDDYLPIEILGIGQGLLFIYLLAGAVTVRLGWKVVEWFRSRDR